MTPNRNSKLQSDMGLGNCSKAKMGISYYLKVIVSLPNNSSLPRELVNGIENFDPPVCSQRMLCIFVYSQILV